MLQKWIQRKLLVVAIFAAASVAHGVPQEANYSVPVEDPALVPFAKFPLQHFSAVLKNSNLSLDYHLPSEIDGAEAHRFRLEGLVPLSGGTRTISGEGAVGECTITPTSARYVDVSCRMEYFDLTVNQEAAMAYLELTQPDLLTRESITRVGAIFAFKPIGIVKTTVKIRR